MRDSNVANAAKESTQNEFSHGLLEFRTRGLPYERQLALFQSRAAAEAMI
jgi:hypothetical protein